MEDVRHGSDRSRKLLQRCFVVALIVAVFGLGGLTAGLLIGTAKLPEPNDADQKALQATADGLLRYFNDMPSVRVIIARPEDFAWSTKDTVGHFLPKENEKNTWGETVILIRSEVIKSRTFHFVQNALKHELIHAWFYGLGLAKDDAPNMGHPRVFIEKAVALDLDPAAISNAVPKNYLQQTMADIKQNGYKLLPRVEQLIKEYEEKLAPLVELRDQGKLTGQQQVELDALFEAHVKKTAALRDELNSQ